MKTSELLSLLLSKATDEKEIAALTKQRDDALAAEAVEKFQAEEKVRVEKEVAAKAEKERQEVLAKSVEARPRASGIEVGAPDIYKGRRFLLELEALGDLLAQKSIDWSEKKIERQAKGWLDLIAAAGGGSALKVKGMPFGSGMSPERLKALLKAGVDESQTSPTEGGYLAAPEYFPDVLAYAREESVALRICRQMPMTSNIMYVPAENAKVSVANTAEAVNATETTPTFAQVTLTAKRWDAFGLISNEFLEDSFTAILPILVSQFMEALGAKNDSAVFDGTGDPMSSVFSAAAGYSQVFGTGSSNFSEILYTDFSKAVGKLSTARQRSARWAIHRTPLWQFVHTLRDTTGRPLFTDPVAGVPGRILGYSVEQLENGPSATGASTAIASFGDYSGVIIGHRKDSIDLLIDPYSAAKSYQTQFYLFTRWAHAMALPNQFVRIMTAA